MNQQSCTIGRYGLLVVCYVLIESFLMIIQLIVNISILHMRNLRKMGTVLVGLLSSYSIIVCIPIV